MATTDSNWWRSLHVDDPITLDPISSLAYPPFELKIPSGLPQFQTGTMEGPLPCISIVRLLLASNFSSRNFTG